MAFDDVYGPGSLIQLEEEMSSPRYPPDPDLVVIDYVDSSEISDRYVQGRFAGTGGTAEIRINYTEVTTWVFTIIRVEPQGIGLYTELCGRGCLSAINRGVTLFKADAVQTEVARAALEASGWTVDNEGIWTVTPETLLAYFDTQPHG